MAAIPISELPEAISLGFDMGSKANIRAVKNVTDEQIVQHVPEMRTSGVSLYHIGKAVEERDFVKLIKLIDHLSWELPDTDICFCSPS